MKILEEKLKSIKDDVMEIHKLARKAVDVCIDGLRGDEEKKKIASDMEQIVDIINTDVDCACVSVVALFQPVARDLRFTMSMMRISANYERITDLAQEIANYTVQDGFDEVVDIFSEIKSRHLKMFDLIGNALKTGNITGLKEELTRLDDEVDGLYNKALEILKETVKRDPQTVDVVVDLIFVARHLERIADILSKIGARIIFIEKGVRVWIK